MPMLNLDPDETARNESSHQDLHCSPFCCFFFPFFQFRLKLLFSTMDLSKYTDGTVQFRNSGLKGLRPYQYPRLLSVEHAKAVLLLRVALFVSVNCFCGGHCLFLVSSSYVAQEGCA